jgi:hypothetical protein
MAWSVLLGRAAAATIAGALLLAACGGSDGDVDTGGTSTPASTRAVPAEPITRSLGLATDDGTMTITADGTFSPDTVSVDTGLLFTVRNDGPTVDGVQVGDIGPVTVAEGTGESYRVNHPGTHQVTVVGRPELVGTLIVG